MIGVIKQRISTNQMNNCNIRSQLYQKATVQPATSLKGLRDNMMIESNPQPISIDHGNRDDKNTSLNISSLITPRQLKSGKARLINQFLSPTNIVDVKEQKTQQFRTNSGIESLDRPANAKTLSLGIQLKETKQERMLQNYEKYQRIWDKYEKNIGR